MKALSSKAIVILICMVLSHGLLSAENISSSGRASDSIQRAMNLGDEFQDMGPWSGHAGRDSGFYGLAQPRDYLTAPESKRITTDQGTDSAAYPLCYNPYQRAYEYCYPRDSAYFQLLLRSADFRAWWSRGRVCPPGYYFRYGKGCYRD